MKRLVDMKKDNIRQNIEHIHVILMTGQVLLKSRQMMLLMRGKLAE